MKHCHRQKGYVLITVVVTLFIVAAVALLLNREGSMGINMARSEAQTQQARYVAEAGISHALWVTNNSNCTGYPSPLSDTFGLHNYKANVTPTTGSPVTITASGTLQSGASRSLTRDGIRIYQPPKPPIVLQPGAGGIDTYVINRIGNDHSNNYGNDPQMRVGTGDANALIKFDVSAIPTDAKILGVELALHFEQADNISSAEMSVHRLLRSWDELEATWDIPNNTAGPWTTLGGDYDSNIEAIAAVSATTNTGYHWDVTNLVSGWVSGAFVNDGLLVRVASGNVVNARFTSSDGTIPSNHPKLTITYACECGKTCTAPTPPTPSCDADFIPDNKAAEIAIPDYTIREITGLALLPEGKLFNSVAAPAGGAWISVHATDEMFMVNMTGVELTNCNSLVNGPMGLSYIEAGTWTGHLAVARSSNLDIKIVDAACSVVGAIPTAATGISKPHGVAYVGATASGTYEQHLVVADSDSPAQLVIIDQTGSPVITHDISALGISPHGVTHIAGTDKLLVADVNERVVVINILTGLQLDEYATAGFGTNTLDAVAINTAACEHVIAGSVSKTITSLNTVGGGTGSTLTANASADTRINEAAGTNNYGSDSLLLTGKDNGKKHSRHLVQFDISSLPVGATVTSAKLRLYLDSGSGQSRMNVGVYKVTASWDEATVTWNNYGGGSFDPSQLDEITTPSSGGSWIEWNLPIGLLHEWRDNVAPNYGLLLQYEGPQKNKQITTLSREHAVTTNRPQLVLEYTMP